MKAAPYILAVAMQACAYAPYSEQDINVREGCGHTYLLGQEAGEAQLARLAQNSWLEDVWAFFKDRTGRYVWTDIGKRSYPSSIECDVQLLYRIATEHKPDTIHVYHIHPDAGKAQFPSFEDFVAHWAHNFRMRMNSLDTFVSSNVVDRYGTIWNYSTNETFEKRLSESRNTKAYKCIKEISWLRRMQFKEKWEDDRDVREFMENEGMNLRARKIGN